MSTWAFDVNPDLIFVFSLIVVASVLFVSGRIRLDVVALMVVLALALSGVLSPREAVAGFGDPVVIIVAGLLVIGRALTQTGVAHNIGLWLSRTGGSSESRLLVLLMLSAALLGSVMSSTAVVAILIPVVLKLASKTNINPSRLLIPLSYAALISGMLTLIATTPNLVVSGELRDEGYDALNFFSFTPIGVGVLLVGTLYMLMVGRRMLPVKRTEAPKSSARKMGELLEDFKLEDLRNQLVIPSSSPLVGQRLADVAFPGPYELRVLLVDRAERFGRTVYATPGSDFVFRADDAFLVYATEEDIDAFAQQARLLQSPINAGHRQRWLKEGGLATVLIHPESKLVGKSLQETALHDQYGLRVLGVMHKGETMDAFAGHKLESGDALLVVGSWKHIGALSSEPDDFVVLALPVESTEAAPAYQRAPAALAILGGMVLLSALEVVPVVVAVLMAALAMVFSRCISMDDAYRSIHWSSVILIAGMLPIADALNQTGGADLIVDGLVSGLGSANPYLMMSVIFFLCAVLGLFLSNTAVAILMAPIAIHAAEALQVSPYAMAMTVAIAASAAFVTPVSTPVVTLVVEPGHYKFIDFVKVGLPMLLLTWLVALIVIPLVFPF